MTTDALGRRRAEKTTDRHATCQCCERLFVDKIKDPDLEAKHATDGYCAGCYKLIARTGTCKHDFPASSYRCNFTTEQNAFHLQRFMHRIAGTSARLRETA